MSSSQSQTQSQSIECAYGPCDEFGHVWEFQGKYCSMKCEQRDAGNELVRGLMYDHTLCYTCFRRLKEIEPSKPDWEFTANGHGWTFDEDGNPTLEYYDQSVTRKAAQGFQHPTKHATVGEKTRGDDVITGTICGECGATDHTDHIPFLADRHALGRLATLLIEDTDVSLDPEVFHREYDDHQDIDLAVGRATQTP